MLKILLAWLAVGSAARGEAVLSGSLELEPGEGSFAGISAVLTDSTGLVVGQVALLDSGKFVVPVKGSGVHRLRLASASELPFEPAFVEFNAADLAAKPPPNFNFRVRGVRFLAKVYLKSGGDSIAYVEPTVVCLFEGEALKQEVRTDAEGVAVFTNLRPGKNLFVLCGKTHHKVASGEMTCHLTHKTERCESILSYEEFTLFGTVEGLPEGLADAAVVFNAPEKEIVCPFPKAGENTFVCRHMTVGRFVASVRSPTASFATSPESLEVKQIAPVTLRAAQVFKLSLSGPEGVKVFFNGKEEVVLGKAPHCREGLPAQSLAISARHPDYDFEDLIVPLTEGANSTQEVRVAPSKLALCGALVGFSGQEVRVLAGGELVASALPRREEFCFMLPRGEYSVEAKDPSGFLVAKEVSLGEAAVKGLELRPREVAASVEVVFLEEPDTPENAALLALVRAAQARTIIKVFNLAGAQIRELRLDAGGQACLAGLGVGAARLRVVNPEMCFEEFEQGVDARHSKVTFTQKGFLHAVQVNLRFRAIFRDSRGEHPLDLSPETRLACLPAARGSLEPLPCHSTEPLKLPLVFPFPAPSAFHLRSVAASGTLQARGGPAFAARVAEALGAEGVEAEGFHARVEGELVRYSFRFAPKAHPLSARLKIASPDQDWFILKGSELGLGLAQCGDSSPNALARPGFVVEGRFPAALPGFVVEGLGRPLRGSGQGFRSEVLESLENLRIRVRSPGFIVSEDLRTRQPDGSLRVDFLAREARPLKVRFLDPSGAPFAGPPISLSVVQATALGESSFTKLISGGEFALGSEDLDQLLLPSLREHSFSPPKLLVNGAKALDQDPSFIVSRTGFSLRGTFLHSLKPLPSNLFLEASPTDPTLPTEVSKVLPSGDFVLPGLRPGQTYLLKLRPHEEVAMVPPELGVEMEARDRSIELGLSARARPVPGSVDRSTLEADPPSEAPYRLVLSRAGSGRYERLLDLEVDDPRPGRAGPLGPDTEEVRRALCASFQAPKETPLPPRQEEKKEPKKLEPAPPQVDREKEKPKAREPLPQKFGRAGLLSMATVATLLVAAGFFAFSRLI